MVVVVVVPSAEYSEKEPHIGACIGTSGSDERIDGGGDSLVVQTHVYGSVLTHAHTNVAHTHAHTQCKDNGTWGQFLFASWWWGGYRLDASVNDVPISTARAPCDYDGRIRARPLCTHG